MVVKMDNLDYYKARSPHLRSCFSQGHYSMDISINLAKKYIKRVLLLLPGGEALLRRWIELRGKHQPVPAAEPSQPEAPEIKEVFTSHYQKNIWGSEETVSGPGSTLEYTSHIRKEIPRLIDTYKIKRFLDAPCGDYHWFQAMERPDDLTYIGGDIVDELVRQNQSRYGNAKTRFMYLDITRDSLPQADLWLCRDCLFHFSYEDIFKTISNFLNSDITFLLTSIHTECKENTNIHTGEARQLNLELPPFNFPRPILYIKDWIPGFTVRSLGLWTRSMISEAMAPNREIQKIAKR